MIGPRPRPHGRLAVFTAVGVLALGAFVFATDPPPPTAKPGAREIARQVETRPDRSPPSPVRVISQPLVDRDPPPGWRPLVGDPDAARLRSLEQRAATRAYDGAPPVMPHSVNFAKSKTCLDCHGEGLWLGKRFASPISHPHMLNCMQCHVESRNLQLSDPGPIENAFAGLPAARGGLRAWDGAPPVMPHGTMMRNDCLSCHGPESYPGLRTDHPERTNCVQCHAVAAELDQTSPFFTGRAILVIPVDDAPDASGPPRR